ncbi:MAG: DUF5655 domain-containing protein, partial [Candidatus Hodarchaeales archaeon]
ITKEELKPVFQRLINEIKGIDENIGEYLTQDYVGFKYNNRQIAWVSSLRKAVDIGAVVIDEKLKVLDYDYVRLETGKEDYSDIMDKILRSYNFLKK